MAYAGQHGRALMDRELYLPKEWAEDPHRRQATTIPEEIQFKAKPQLAQQMIERAVAANVPFAWVAGDEVNGGNRSLRVWLEQQDLHLVLAVRSNQYVCTVHMRQKTVEQLGNAITDGDWQTLSAGDGTKGLRWYDWVRVPLLSWQMPGERWLLLRKSRSDGKLAYFVCYEPPGTDLQAMVQVAGMRWMVEERFEAAKGEVGFDQYEVLSWHSWYRHITLAMLAHAFLAAACTSASEIERFKKKHRTEWNSGSSTGYLHRTDGARNQKAAVQTGMALSAGCARGDPLVALATAPSGRRPVLSLAAQRGSRTTYSCSNKQSA